ncbi:MAG: hypothetical protein E7495_09275 [Ruminococcus flavefaciens]|jgi:hypothetical protein|nr:hypothetical protein [Ruminococcus flavefaciens]
MECKDFIAKLYIKGAWLTKADFTKKLILSSVNDDSCITEKRKSESLYKGFNSGQPINAVAYDVLDDLNRPGIVSFLSEYLNNKPDEKSANVQTLCGKFKDDIPDISPENLCEKIADFFVDEVLSPAAKEYEKTLANFKTTPSKKVPAPVRNADELAELKALINELNVLFTDLDEKGSVLYLSPFQRSEEEQNEKELELEALKSDFINEHKKLRRYYLSFPDLKELFEEMSSLSRTLTFWYGYKYDEQNRTRIVCDSQIEKYRKCVDKAWAALSE